MNIVPIYISLVTVLQLCLAQDYNPTYNPNIGQSSSTNDYPGLNSQNDPKYDNPYDPNRRYQNRNQFNTNQYSTNQNVYDPNQRYDNRNDPLYTNQNPFNQDNTPRPSWDSSRTYSTSYKSSPVEHDNVIINEA